MTKLNKSVLVSAMVIALVLLFPMLASAEPPQDAAAGQKTWEAKLCKNCHGPMGEGRYAGPLAGTARTTAEAIAQVRGPRAQMPAFNAQQISDQEITDIVDYMKTLTRPAAFTPVRYDAKADDPPGKVLFNQKRCAACHGENFQNTAPLLARAGRKGLTLAEVTKQVRTPANMMPTFKTDFVTDADIATMQPWLNAQVVAAAAAAPAAPAPAATPGALPTTGGDPSTLAMALISLMGFLSVAAGLVLRRRR